MFGSISWRKCTIANGAALSDVIDMTGRTLVCIYQPASCEGTAFGLQGSYDYDPVKLTGSFTSIYNVIQEATGAAPVTALWEVAKSATVAQIINLPAPFQVTGPNYIKIRSEDGSNAATNQSGDAVLYLGFVDIR